MTPGIVRKLTAMCLAASILVATTPARAFVLAEPPATRFAMNLTLVPDTPFTSIGFGNVTWNALAETALAEWNGIGVGIGNDSQFFWVLTPPLANVDVCNRQDGVNAVAFLGTLCGVAWGDVLGATLLAISNGLTVEVSVLFNQLVTYNAYRGPLRQPPDFYRLVLHEFGHVVGLDHPDQAGQVVTALMNSHESDVDDVQPDDIAGAHAVNWTGAVGLPPSSRAPAFTTAATATVPLFRFFNSVKGTHFYTTSESERLSIIRNLPAFVFEGVAYNVPSVAGPGTVTVYRFFNTLSGAHFYTTSAAERDQIIATAPYFQFEGVAFQAFSGGPGLAPVFRFFDTLTGTHFYTASTAERDQILATAPSYRLEGIAYFVAP
jgi:uncharacterized protein DUF5648/matrixin